ncbi:MAG TPA: hypothetical protein VI636_13545 [Candidatus Angelobacter sp.]
MGGQGETRSDNIRNEYLLSFQWLLRDQGPQEPAQDSIRNEKVFCFQQPLRLADGKKSGFRLSATKKCFVFNNLRGSAAKLVIFQFPAFSRSLSAKSHR